MPSFDYIADESVKPEPHDWMEQAALLRKFAADNKTLTEKRIAFIHTKAIEKPDNNNHGAYKALMVPLKVNSFGLNTVNISKEEALAGFPQYSARLLLHFKLISPLLSHDDEPFYLIDNPARKDHIFKSPYLSAAGMKGLSVDAYQRAFPVKDWHSLADKEQDRSRAYRMQDHYAQRLFGLADDGVQSEDKYINTQRGRLRFSPVWFQQLQFLVLNPKDTKTGQGGIPIQFEAVAPEQTATLEVIYFNPYGISDSSEATVRGDLARWLASVASWWSVLGLGGKRLAGYGQIEIQKVQLQAMNWSGMAMNVAKNQGEQSKKTSKEQVRPANYELFLDQQAQLISAQELQDLIAQQIQQLDIEITELDDKRRHTQGKAQSKAIKAWEKAKKKRDTQDQQLTKGYQKALTYWQDVGQPELLAQEHPAVMTLPEYPIVEKELQGKDSWLQMAQWMAGEKDA